MLRLEFLHILKILFLPTLFMGATLPLVMLAVTRSRSRTSTEVGRVYSINTVGTIVGSILGGFVLLTSPLGIQGTLVLGATLSALIALFVFLYSPGFSRPIGMAFAAAVVIAYGGSFIFAGSAPLEKATITAGAYLGEKNESGEIIYYRDGVDATVSVHEIESGDRFLRINGKTDASSLLGDMSTQVSLAQMPMLLSKKKDDVLVIGLGAGITTASAALHRDVKRLDILEVSQGVVDAARHYFSRSNRAVLDDPRVTLYRNDGRNHLLLFDRLYDVIISEPSNPWMAGISNLFTREFFELARSRLREDGVYCQWIHSYSMAPSDFLMIVRTILEVFPNATLWQPKYADFLLIAGNDVADVSVLSERMFEPRIYADLEAVGLENPARLVSSCLARSDELARWVGPGPVNTDDNSLLEFSAPFHLLREDSRAIARSLEHHKSSPIGNWIPDENRLWSPALRNLETRNRNAVFKLYSLTEGGGILRRDMLGELERLYRMDPGDWRSWYFLNITLASLEAELRSGGGVDEQATREFVERMRSTMRPPDTGPLTSFEAKLNRVAEWVAELEKLADDNDLIRAHEMLARIRNIAGEAHRRGTAMDDAIEARIGAVERELPPLPPDS